MPLVARDFVHRRGAEFSAGTPCQRPHGAVAFAHRSAGGVCGGVAGHGDPVRADYRVDTVGWGEKRKVSFIP